MKKLNQIIKILAVIIAIGCLSTLKNQVFATNAEIAEEKTSNINITKIAEKKGEKKKTSEETNPSGGNDTMSGIIDAASGWLEQGKNKNSDMNDPLDFANKFVGIGQILVAIGVVTLVIVTAIMAIQWITATPDKQAKLKTQLIGLVVSAVVIFGAIGIWNLIRGIGQEVENKITSSTQNSIVVVAKK